MNTALQYIIQQLRDSYEGDPWHGGSVKNTLERIPVQKVFVKPSPGAHSPLELLYHIVIWREFTISRLVADQTRDPHYFEEKNWQALDHKDHSLWQKGLWQLQDTQERLINILQEKEDDLLEKIVPERKYNYRFLLQGTIQHDIYHTGQLAYIGFRL